MNSRDEQAVYYLSGKKTLYIHHLSSVSVFCQPNGSGKNIVASENGKLISPEPVLEGIPPAMLRRMSKAVRMGIGAATPLLKSNQADGIIIGTANGGMEDCIKFLNQIIDYDEGMLTPGNFVQSTPNAIGGQLSLIKKNRSYNATHVHKGLAFENALIDAGMLIREKPSSYILAGGVDEISSYNYNIDRLAGWYDSELDNQELYTGSHTATIAGEGAAMFLLNGLQENALAKIDTIRTIHTTDFTKLGQFITSIFENCRISNNAIHISGDNGDNRFTGFYSEVQKQLKDLPVLRFKHITGEYPTASSFAVWLAVNLLTGKRYEDNIFKTALPTEEIDQVIIYNTYQGVQHAILILSK